MLLTWNEERLKKLCLLAKEVAKSCKDNPRWTKSHLRVQTSGGPRRADAWLLDAESIGVTDYGNIIVPIIDGSEAHEKGYWRHLKTPEDFIRYIRVEQQLDTLHTKLIRRQAQLRAP